MKSTIGGIEFDNVTMREAVEQIVAMARNPLRPRMVCTANLDHMVTMSRDPEFLSLYQSADFVVADGMPLVWLSRLTQTRLKERVAGSDLFWELAAESGRSPLKLFFLGGRPGSAEAAAGAVLAKYPNAQIVGIHCPPVGTLNTPEEEARIQAMICQSSPDILLVALGSPKQEKWIAAHRDRLKVPVSIGVGGSFEMAAGSVKRAPQWLQKLGLEWLYRLSQEPSRLARRYLVADFPYLMVLVFRILTDRRKRRADVEPAGQTAAAGSPASTK